MKRFLPWIFFPLTGAFIPAQEYVWPTDAGKTLISNFGEFREDHFHMGIDIRTGGKEGASVFAIDDGYIIRIVSNFKGYGKALYIMHPDSSTSVYAHLSRFNPKFESLLKYHQTKNETYSINQYFKPNELKVKKGDIIGYTGNTGYSYGPHLHFEIRNAYEQPVNPQTHGFKIDDRLSPRLEELAIIPLNKESRVNGSILPVQVPFFRKPDGQYILADTINCYGPVGFAVRSVDKRQGTPGSFQVRSLELTIDGIREYSIEYNKLDYNETDRVQLVRNHNFYRLNLGSFHNLFHSSPSLSAIIQPKNMTGHVKLPPGYHRFHIEVTDANGNTTIGKGMIFVHPPVELVIQDINQTENTMEFSINSKFINIPLKSITCYSFTSSGLADNKLEPKVILTEKDGLKVIFNRRQVHNRSLQFIAKNKMGAYSYPLHWHPKSIITNFNAKPDLDITQSPAGVIIQVETGNMGTAKPEIHLTKPNALQNISLFQIQPFTFISTPIATRSFASVTKLTVNMYNGMNYQYNYSFKPSVASPGQKTVVLSVDEMCSLQLLNNSLYDSTLIWIEAVDYSAPPPHGKFLSKVYQLQPFEKPLQNKVNLGIRYSNNVEKMEKISLYYYNQDDGWTFIPSNNSKKRNVLTGSLNSLESVCILQDTIPPIIKSTFPSHGGHYYFQDVQKLKVDVDDRLSGIEPVESAMSLSLDGKRLLFAYQPIDQTISYDLLDPLSLGKHFIKIIIRDRSGNEISKTVDFYIQ